MNTEPAPLTQAEAIPSALGPLANSFDANAREAALKAIFMDVFEAMIRPRLAEIETQAIAHRGPLAVVQQAIKADGLAMEKPGADEEYIRQLYRAWKARNPRRGLSFLTQYLQMLWPDLWECDQMWQDPNASYPAHSYRKQRAGHFLTNRVMVAVEVDDPTGAELLKMRGSFRSVLAARFVILMALLRRFYNTRSTGQVLNLACAGSFTLLYGRAGSNTVDHGPTNSRYIPSILIINPGGEDNSTSFLDDSGNGVAIASVSGANYSSEVQFAGVNSIHLNGGWLTPSPTSVFNFVGYSGATVELYWYPPEDTSHRYCIFVDSRTYTGSLDGFVVYYDREVGAISMYCREYQVLSVVIPGFVEKNTWHHVAVVLDNMTSSGADVVLYFDGDPVASGSITSYHGFASTDRAFIGSDDYANNCIDSFGPIRVSATRVYDGPFVPDFLPFETPDIYRADFASSPSVGDYSIRGGTPSVSYDEVGNRLLIGNDYNQGLVAWDKWGQFTGQVAFEIDVTLLSDLAGIRHFGFYLAAEASGQPGYRPSNVNERYLTLSKVVTDTNVQYLGQFFNTAGPAVNIGQQYKLRVERTAAGVWSMAIDGSAFPQTVENNMIATLRPGFFVYGCVVAISGVRAISYAS